MARIRYIKPEFHEDTKLAEVSILARYLYMGMFCHMDCQGVCVDDPRFLKAKIFPYDDDIPTKRVGELLEELIKNGRLFRYQAEGKNYLFCPSLPKHQKFHHNEKPKYPSPALPPTSRVLTGDKQETSPLPVPINARTSSTGNWELERVTGNGELVTETEIIQADANAPALGESLPIPKKSKFNDSTRGKMRAFIARYAELYKNKYGGPPAGLQDKAIIGKLGHWIEHVSEVRAVSLVEVYMQISYRQIDESYHDLWQFFRHMNRIGVALDTGKDANQVDWSKVFAGGT